MSSTLPTYRTILTSLIDSLELPASTAAANASPTTDALSTATAVGAGAAAPTPSILAPDRRTRDRLLTLHALHPTALLPALDALDRGLVTRLVVARRAASASAAASAAVGSGGGGAAVAERMDVDAAAAGEADGDGDGRAGEEEGDAQRPRRAPVYYVRSAEAAAGDEQSALGGHYHHHHRRGRGAGGARAGAAPCYEVRLCAWHCSCAAFAFAAFPASRLAPSLFAAAAPGPHDEERGRAGWPASAGGGVEPADEDEQEAGDAAGGRGWIAGGLSRIDGGDVALCKHLLACLLAERVAGLRAYAVEREVSAEEAAGWAAGVGG
jgi:hypothetical protein